MILLKEKKL